MDAPASMNSYRILHLRQNHHANDVVSIHRNLLSNVFVSFFLSFLLACFSIKIHITIKYNSTILGD